mmetsp:Transcript_48252/g.55538  ORF Transcript_48252/g.55538 Transcript_48252/m.55538 type:complete len:757 (+) Transcript_48252:74-2344(+)
MEELRQIQEDKRAFLEEIQALTTRNPLNDPKFSGHHADVQHMIRQFSDNLKELNTKIGDLDNHYQKVCKPVKKLELSIQNVQKCHEKLTELIELQDCVKGVETAIEGSDYEHAASFIQKYIELKNILQIERKDAEFLNQTKDKLSEIVRQKFSQAVREQSAPDIERFAKLFVPVGLHAEGLKKYLNYIAEALARDIKGTMDHFNSRGEADKRFMNATELAFSQQIEKILDMGITYFDSQKSFIKENFGRYGKLRYLAALRDVINRKVIEFIGVLMKEKRVVEACRDIDRGDSERYTAEKLDYICEEVTAVSHQVQLFEMFFTDKAKKLTKKISNGCDAKFHVVWTKEFAEANGLSFQDGLVVSDVDTKLQEICGYYLVIEKAYQLKNFNRTLQTLDITTVSKLATENIESDEPILAQASGVVDDIYYVLLKCVARSLTSFDLSSACGLLIHISELLKESYIEAFDNLTDQFFKKEGFRMFGGSDAANKTIEFSKERTIINTGLIIILNNIELSSDYVDKLIDQLRQEFENQFQVDLDKDEFTSDSYIQVNEHKVNMFLSQVENLKEIQVSLRSFLHDRIKFLINSFFVVIKAYLEPFTTLSFEINEETFSNYGNSDPFMEGFIYKLRKGVNQWQLQLSPPNFDDFIECMVEMITIRMEKIITQKRFNEFGGIHLERSIRQLQSFFQGCTSKIVRAKFQRLQNICSLLALSDPKDIRDYIGIHSSNEWVLGNDEIKAFLSLRSDFAPEQIHNLKALQ